MALPQTIPAAETEIAGLACLLDPSGAMFFPVERVLVVADLHLEKGSSYARRGSFLPPYDTRVTISALAVVVGRYAPARVVALGDSFHDRHGPGRLGDAERAALADVVGPREWIWVTGNHDPELPPEIGGEVASETAANMPVSAVRCRPGSAEATEGTPCRPSRAAGLEAADGESSGARRPRVDGSLRGV